MSNEKDDDAEGEAPAANERRAFMRNAAAMAVGAGVLVASGDAVAAAPKKNRFTFSTNIAPGALTDANIAKITDAVTAALAEESKAGMEVAPAGFHIRIGGGHSRGPFSKTSEHKNVGHSQIIIEGSFP
jgi:hypothetical protein